MRPPGPLVALRLIFAAPVPLRDQLVFALHCTSMRTYAGYSTGCGVDPLYKFKFSEYTEQKRGTLLYISDVKSALRGHWGGVENPVCVLAQARVEVTTAKMQYSAYRNDCSLDYHLMYTVGAK